MSNAEIDIAAAVVRMLLPDDWIVVSAGDVLCVVAMRAWEDGTMANIWCTELGLAYGWIDDGNGNVIADATGFVPLVIDDITEWAERITG